MKPARWVEHHAGFGGSYIAARQITQGPCVNAARSTQKLRLDTVTGRNAPCGRLTRQRTALRGCCGILTKPKPGAEAKRVSVGGAEALASSWPVLRPRLAQDARNATDGSGKHADGATPWASVQGCRAMPEVLRNHQKA